MFTKHRILVLGATGQVGFELRRALAPLGDVLAFDRKHLDLTDPLRINLLLTRYEPTIVVNPAAYTEVDKAESERDLAMQINAQAPEYLANWCEHNDAFLLHYSSNFVFDGNKFGAYVETDIPNPINVYGRSKLLGEMSIRRYCQRHLILRTGWVAGPHGNNFLKTILRLAAERQTLSVVQDQIGSPTSAALLADVTAHLIKAYQNQLGHFAFGTYHLTSGGHTNWYEYARYVLQLAKQYQILTRTATNNILPIKTEDYPLPALRPNNQVLDCSKLAENFGLFMPYWQNSVQTVFAELNHQWKRGL